jgi:hypothetical protein
VIFRRIVGDERRGDIRGIEKRRRKNVTLGWVEVATTRVDPKRPGREASGFPSGEREGVVEKRREGGEGERERRGREGIEKGRVMRGERSGGLKKREGRGGDEPEEGIGLIGPVKPTGSARVTRCKRVLSPVVVGNGLVYVLGLILREMVREARRGGVNHCQRKEIERASTQRER